MEITHETFGSSNPNMQKQPVKQPMSRNDLFQLLELGRIEDELKIGEIVFKLKTLSAIELSNVYKTFSDIADMDEKDANAVLEKDRSQYLLLSSTILANAIISVNDVPMEQMVDGENQDPILLKKDIIINFQWPVIHKLMNFYTEMAAKAGAEFGEELKK